MTQIYEHHNIEVSLYQHKKLSHMKLNTDEGEWSASCSGRYKQLTQNDNLTCTIPYLGVTMDIMARLSR